MLFGLVAVLLCLLSWQVHNKEDRRLYSEASSFLTVSTIRGERPTALMHGIHKHVQHASCGFLIETKVLVLILCKHPLAQDIHVGVAVAHDTECITADG